jgi:hypothetical protein
VPFLSSTLSSFGRPLSRLTLFVLPGQISYFLFLASFVPVLQFYLRQLEVVGLDEVGNLLIHEVYWNKNTTYRLARYRTGQYDWRPFCIATTFVGTFVYSFFSASPSFFLSQSLLLLLATGVKMLFNTWSIVDLTIGTNDRVRHKIQGN